MAERARVLVGANVSEHSDEAIRQGDAWARAHGWQLVVCHAAPSPLGVHMLFPQLTEQEVLAQPDLELKLEQALREHVAKLTGRPPDEMEVVVTTGAPEREIARAAEERSARLVVIGSHSHSGLKDIFLGDVAENIVRHAHCSVLVARPHPTTRRILVATDFSADATSAVVIAAGHARLTGARLTVACSIERRMEIVREMTNFGAAYDFVQHELDHLQRTAKKRLAEQLASVGISGETMVLEGKPAAALVHTVGEIDADLVVIGASSISGLRNMFLGSVAERVARAAPSSVLVSRTPPFA